MEVLDGMYIRGFTDGLREAQKIIGYIIPDIKKHKRRPTEKTLTEVFNVAFRYREELRENPNAFIRCNSNGGFECFDSAARKVIGS